MLSLWQLFLCWYFWFENIPSGNPVPVAKMEFVLSNPFISCVHRRTQPGWPDEKSNIMCSGKSTQIGLFLYFFSKLPKVNDRPMGENSPNPVTLSHSHRCTRNAESENVTYIDRYEISNKRLRKFRMSCRKNGGRAQNLKMRNFYQKYYSPTTALSLPTTRVTRWVCEKNRPKCCPTHFCRNLYIIYT
jgi:hypothetical protein